MHIPVLQKEVSELLDPQPNENFIDATIGNGGHTLAILERNIPKGKVLGIDADPEMIKNLESGILNIEFKKRIIFANGNFVNLKEIVKKEEFKNVSGILFDLGLSSWHFEESGKGFTFKKNEPLDMRYNNEANELTAEKIVNYWSFQEIEKILREYGEERFAKNVAEEIIRARKISPIKTTFQLIEIIKRAVPVFYQKGRINFATRTFQALRIAVNDELNNLTKALPQALEVLKPGGRLLVISFHSLEDKIVKDFYRGPASANLKIINKKPIIPTNQEIINNPRSRSAKLRAAVKT